MPEELPQPDERAELTDRLSFLELREYELHLGAIALSRQLRLRIAAAIEEAAPTDKPEERAAVPQELEA